MSLAMQYITVPPSRAKRGKTSQQSSDVYTNNNLRYVVQKDSNEQERQESGDTSNNFFNVNVNMNLNLNLCLPNSNNGG